MQDLLAKNRWSALELALKIHNVFYGEPYGTERGPQLLNLFGSFGDWNTWKEELVDVTGLEPATPCLQSRCSPN